MPTNAQGIPAFGPLPGEEASSLSLPVFFLFMWLHAIGWHLPRTMELAWLGLCRQGRLLVAGMLEPWAQGPLYPDPDLHFLQLTLGQAAFPMGAAPTAKHLVARGLPVSGVQVLPGHHLQLVLRLPWPATYRPAAAHWPMGHWITYLRTWHLQRCPRQYCHWWPGAWRPVPPFTLKPVQVTYSPTSQQAEWTFELYEP